jgi:hypothetical protein
MSAGTRELYAFYAAVAGWAPGFDAALAPAGCINGGSEVG